ncbi:MAG TPA: hypothetical protein VIG52_06225 [Methyloceanibacter sp.]|jgi:hypothetical protein
MQKAWVQLGGVIAIAALMLLGTASLLAAQEAGVKTAAEELDKRSKPAEGAGGQQGKLSDRSVNVMSSLAFSILPDETPGPDGKPIKVNKSNPNKFLVPVEDARRIIRVATRSAYAEACGLIDLERANYEALMKSEEARKTWTREQLLFIRALHVFSVSYFTGNMQITTTEQENDVQSGQTAGDLADSKGKDPAPAQKDPAPAQQEQSAAEPSAPKVLSPKKLECPPEQKEKVTKSINAYVQSAKVEAEQGAKPAAPAAPAASDAPKSAPAAPQAAPAPAGAPN